MDKEEQKINTNQNKTTEITYDYYVEKYNFPKFSVLSKEFDIDEFESDFILKEIRNKLKDRFDDASKIIETLFQPEGDFASFIETKSFENGVKDEYFGAYKILRSMVRKAQMLSFMNDDDSDKKYILESLKEWSSIRPVVIELLGKLESCWSDRRSDDNVKYFG